MVRVTLSPEAVASFRRLPESIKHEYDTLIIAILGMARMRLPGRLAAHRLEGARGLWTLKAGPYRAIFRWDGNELRFIRFGHRASVYSSLPK